MLVEENAEEWGFLAHHLDVDLSDVAPGDADADADADAGADADA
jgi:hypothetical protein